MDREIILTDMKKYSGYRKELYQELLDEKRDRLEMIKSENEQAYRKICKKTVEYELIGDIYGYDTDEAVQIADDFEGLRDCYEQRNCKEEIDALTMEIKWLEIQLREIGFKESENIKEP
jgi:hypothetical protein